MNAERHKALEARGYRIYDHAADALGLTDDERELMDIRIELAISVRKRREELQLSQKDLAIRLKTTQPRIVRIEQAAPDVSLDQIFRAYAAMGGRILVKKLAIRSANGVKGGAKPEKKRRASLTTSCPVPEKTKRE
jgi:ribosome-binding protein aMBF1 (putative translation factor)